MSIIIVGDGLVADELAESGIGVFGLSYISSSKWNIV